MSKSARFTSAASFIALASMIAGCAAPQHNRVSTSGLGGRAGGEIGLATRALMALNANDVATAIVLAERAVEKTPDDAGFRALLGNAYFAAGRFASAEAAYEDALSIYSNQPRVVLKLALVQIAQGKHAEAVSFLDAGRSVLDPADYGLALALAGRAADAIPVLETSARVPGADPRVRQNLALAYAFAGDWTQARTIAAQDVPAGDLDARLQQWMQLAKPAKASDQVAALTGVTPAAADPGQPTRLALRKSETKVAQVAQAPAPAPAPQQIQQAEAAPPPPPPLPPEYVPAPQFAEAPPAPAPQIEYVAPLPPPPPVYEGVSEPAPKPRKPAKLHRGSVTVKLPPVRNASLRRGTSAAVVQLGAYGSRQRVALAWDTITKRYPALRNYQPMTARFDSRNGTVYRLAIKGFASQQEAIARCRLLKSRGGSCFVRNVAGDAPIQIASR